MRMKIKILVMGCCVLMATSVQAKTINSPVIPALEAIAKVGDYIQLNNIDILGHFLSEIKYFNLHNEYERPYWRIVYTRLSGAVSEIIFIVAEDGSIFQEREDHR